jgi:Lrp/AsnC family leucine-responsive transcriptional regulator
VPAHVRPSDYLLWVATADLEAYERLCMARLTGLPGVARNHSQFTMKTVKGGASLAGPPRG